MKENIIASGREQQDMLLLREISEDAVRDKKAYPSSSLDKRLEKELRIGGRDVTVIQSWPLIPGMTRITDWIVKMNTQEACGNPINHCSLLHLAILCVGAHTNMPQNTHTSLYTVATREVNGNFCKLCNSSAV